MNGLSGTGSKSIVIKDVFVPSHRVLNTQLIYGGPSPGSEINPGPLSKVPPLSVGTKVFSGVALGLARGALELIVEEYEHAAVGWPGLDVRAADRANSRGRGIG